MKMSSPKGVITI
jgi:hypothetical protein